MSPCKQCEALRAENARLRGELERAVQTVTALRDEAHTIWTGMVETTRKWTREPYAHRIPTKAPDNG